MNKRRVLICTTGTGRGSEVPVQLSVEYLNPDKAVLIVTEESKRRIEEIGLVSYLEERGVEYGFYEIDEAENMDLVFRRCAEMLQKLERAEDEEPEVYLNYTSGTKSISVGLCLAGLLMNYSNYCYVGGKMRDEFGRVTKAEEVKTYKVYFIREAMLKRDIATLLNRFNYKGAMDILSTYKVSDQMEKVRNTIDLLSHWDAFDHNHACELIKGNKPFVKQIEEMRKRYAHSLKRICEEKNGKPPIGVYTLADLILNARRRIEEGKYDDAVARIYRSSEMAFQILLWQNFGISTTDVDTEMEIFSPKERETLRKWKGDAEKLQLGLRKAAELLSWKIPDVKDILVDLEKHLAKRNYSALAHGSTPVSRENALSFMKFFEQAIIPIVENHCGENLEKIMENMKFPVFEEIS